MSSKLIIMFMNESFWFSFVVLDADTSTYPCISHVCTFPIAYSACPFGATKVVKLDENDMIISYTQKPNIILRTAFESLVLLFSIETMRTPEEMNDSAPVMIGENMSAFCCFRVYMMLLEIICVDYNHVHYKHVKEERCLMAANSRLLKAFSLRFPGASWTLLFRGFSLLCIVLSTYR